MQAVDDAVEAWRRDQLSRLLPLTSTPTAILAQVAHAASVHAQSVSPTPFHWQYSVDRILRGLQFALNGLPQPRAHGPSIRVPTDEVLSVALEIIRGAERYADARDLFLTYRVRGFDLDEGISHERLLRFVQPIDWDGSRDYADQVIARRIEEERAHDLYTGTSHLPLPTFIDEALRLVHLPAEMPLGEITVAEFLPVWRALSIRGSRWMAKADVPRFERHVLSSVVQRDTRLSQNAVRQALELLRFDPTDSRLTCFHTPILLDETGRDIVLPSAFVFGNPRVVVPRLCVRRGPGLDALTTSVAHQLAERLKKHYESDRIVIMLEYAYESPLGSGDIDLMAYDRDMHRLVLAEIKAFIPPATVIEVVHANEALEDGLIQIDRARQWLETGGMASLLSRLSARSDVVPDICYAVLGNGFSGSDYLPIPDDVTLANADYLLRPIFEGAWIGEALAKWRTESAAEQSAQLRTIEERTIILGDITIRAPGKILPD